MPSSAGASVTLSLPGVAASVSVASADGRPVSIVSAPSIRAMPVSSSSSACWTRAITLLGHC